jgi:hypothetical protein
MSNELAPILQYIKEAQKKEEKKKERKKGKEEKKNHCSFFSAACTHLD